MINNLKSPNILKYILSFGIIIILLCVSYYYLLCDTESFNVSVSDKPIIWSYWENVAGHDMPEYIKLCFKTLFKHCGNNFNIIILNDKTVYNYLPDLRKDINNLKLALKVDYIRVKLLKTYGGIWIDADTIVIRDLSEIINKLMTHDFVGFGCSDAICFNGYPKPSNGVMASRKSGKIVSDYLNVLDDKLNEASVNNTTFDYFDLGKLTLWTVLEMNDNKKIYYHYDSKYDGSRDKSGIWISVDNHISTRPTQFIDEDKLFFVFLENNKFMGQNPKYNFFSKLSEKEILNSNYWISDLFKKALDENVKFT